MAPPVNSKLNLSGKNSFNSNKVNQFIAKKNKQNPEVLHPSFWWKNMAGYEKYYLIITFLT